VGSRMAEVTTGGGWDGATGRLGQATGNLGQAPERPRQVTGRLGQATGEAGAAPERPGPGNRRGRGGQPESLGG